MATEAASGTTGTNSPTQARRGSTPLWVTKKKNLGNNKFNFKNKSNETKVSIHPRPAAGGSHGRVGAGRLGGGLQADADQTVGLDGAERGLQTALSAGSTTGRTLGSADAVTYYYVTSNLSFTNSTAGGSGLTIQGTVYLYIPTGVTLTSTGAKADGRTGAGAGIELTAGNSLYLIGGGTLNEVMMNISSVAQAAPVATAAAVPVLALARAAATAELAAAAVNALDLILMRPHSMALMVILAVPVVPLASWARSMFTRLWPPQ